MSTRSYQHHFQSSAEVNATPEVLFAELDDHERLSAHMMRSSAMMAGNKMRFDLDERRGQDVGSKIAMSGTLLGIELWLQEVVTEREPPRRKVWETVGQPRLLVIGDYRMGFQIEPLISRSRLTVFIDYDEPRPPWTVLGKMLGSMYARWCTVNMTEGPRRHFAALMSATGRKQS